MRSLILALGALGLAACSSPGSDAGPADANASPTVPAAPGRFRIGASRVKITPTKFGWMTGYGNRNRPADGVKTDLWTRALAIEDEAGKRAVLVTADIL